MERPSNTNQNFVQVVENLMLGKPCGLSESTEKENKLSFEDFLTVLSEVSEHSVSWREYPIGDKLLYLFSTEWQIQNPLPESNTDSQNFINKFFNSLVIEVSTDSVDNKAATGYDTKNENPNIVKTDYKVVMYGGPKVYDSNRDKTSLEKIRQFIGKEDIVDGSKVKIYDAYEGTTINVFNHNSVWYFSTKRKLNMFESKFAKQRNHGEMVTDIISIDQMKQILDTNFTYHFVLVHSDNSHLSHISENKLILTSVRTSSNFKEHLSEYERVIEDSSGKFTKPTPRGSNGLDDKIINSLEDNSLEDNSLEDNSLEDNSLPTQGVIIQYNDFVFRLYNKSYGEKLKQNPLFHTKHERCIFDYQNNKYAKKDPNEVDSDEKTWTKAAFDFVAICLFRALMHFTKFADKFTEEEKSLGYKFIKKNEDKWDYYILKHKYKNNALIRNLYKLQRLPYSVKDLVDVDFNQVKHHLKHHCTPQDIKSMFDRFYLDINTDQEQPDDKSLCDIIGYKRCNGVFNNIESFKLQQKNISDQDQGQGSYQDRGGGRGRGQGRGGYQSRGGYQGQGRGRGGYQDQGRGRGGYQGQGRGRGGYQGQGRGRGVL